MDIKVLRLVLDVLKTRTARDTPKQRLIIRVATRKIQADLHTEYDRFLRLQVLEGAMGIPVGHWWNKGSRGLVEAQSSFQGLDLNPLWLSARNTGMFMVLEKVTDKALNSYHVPLEPLDVINNALMGLGLDASTPGHILRPPYEAGKYLSKPILGGKETPISVAKGLLGRFLVRKIQAESKTVGFGMPEDAEGRQKDLPQGPTSDMNAGDLLVSIFFHDLSDPLGREIRDFMRSTWAGTPRQVPMDLWLDAVEQGRIPKKQDIATQAGILPQVFSQNHWNPAWHAFFQALWKNGSLLHKLQDRYEQEGVEWFQVKPDIDALVTRRKAGTVESVVSRWYQGCSPRLS